MQQQQNFMNAPFKIERRCVQLQLFRLDLGIVEYVVDDDQQRFARITDGVYIKLLLFFQIGFGKQVCHAYNPVHRCPDFVAHVGQES